MRLRIERLEGERDGLRHGRIRIGRRVLCFTYDRLSGAVSLSQTDAAQRNRYGPPTTQERAAARKALHEELPPLTLEGQAA